MRSSVSEALRKVLGVAAVVVFAALLPDSALAQAAVTEVDASPDITVNLGGTVTNDEDVALDTVPSAGAPPLAGIGALPPSADVSAYHLLPGAEVLFSLDITVSLPGSSGAITVGPRDVVRYDGAFYSRAFDGAAAGVPAGARIDAIGVYAPVGGAPPADLLLSFDVTVSLPQNGGGTITVDDEDLARWEGPGFTLFFDGSAAGVNPALDLDGVHSVAKAGPLLVSFDGSGVVGTATFDDEDVLEWDPVSGIWEPVAKYDGSAQHPGWPAADLDGFHALCDAADPDCDGFMSGADNCPDEYNPSQADSGGINTTTADGIGDACQCGDVTNNGIVQINDATIIKRAILGLGPGLAAPLKCNVIGPTDPSGGAVLPNDCLINDATIVKRNILGLGPAIAQVCAPALP